VHFIGWLRRNELFAPTPEELEQLYLDHDAFQERALEWDKKEQLLIAEYERQKRLNQTEEPAQVEEGEQNVQSWDPSKGKDDEGEVAVVSEIDQIEQEYLKEYYDLVEKDKAAGKDFNKLRHDQMMDYQFEFALARKEEKQRYEWLME